jgi:hypothetical protein
MGDGCLLARTAMADIVPFHYHWDTRGWEVVWHRCLDVLMLGLELLSVTELCTLRCSLEYLARNRQRTSLTSRVSLLVFLVSIKSVTDNVGMPTSRCLPLPVSLHLTDNAIVICDKPFVSQSEQYASLG